MTVMNTIVRHKNLVKNVIKKCGKKCDLLEVNTLKDLTFGVFYQ